MAKRVGDDETGRDGEKVAPNDYRVNLPEMSRYCGGGDVGVVVVVVVVVVESSGVVR
jgi:hypothetical protein